MARARGERLPYLLLRKLLPSAGYVIPVGVEA